MLTWHLVVPVIFVPWLSWFTFPKTTQGAGAEHASKHQLRKDACRTQNQKRFEWVRYEIDTRVRRKRHILSTLRLPRGLVLTGRRHRLWSADYSGAAIEEAEWSLLLTTHVNRVSSRTHSHTVRATPGMKQRGCETHGFCSHTLSLF